MGELRKARNVILILMDTVRRDYLSVYNPATMVKTPNIEKLGRVSSVYENGFIGSFPCMPARRDLFTGRLEYLWRGWGPLEENDITLPKILTEKGITTELISDHYHLWEKGSGNYHFDFSGFEFIRGQENDHWKTNKPQNLRYPAEQSKLCQHMMDVESGNNDNSAFERYKSNTSEFKSEEDFFPAKVMRASIRWLEENANNGSFFLLIDNFDPHEPFDPPPNFDEIYQKKHLDYKLIWPTYGYADQYSDDEIDNIRALYSGELTFVDKWFGRFLERVEELGLMENTMICLVSDHGFMMGEHNLIGKPWSGRADPNLYNELARIPFIVYNPDAKGGSRDSRIVQLIDFLPTVLDYFHIEYDVKKLHGRSLLRSKAQQRDKKYAIFGKFGDCLNITDGEWVAFIPPLLNNPPIWVSETYPYRLKYVYRSNEGFVIDYKGDETMTEKLYNIVDDPQQTTNRRKTDPLQYTKMKKEAHEILRRIGAPEVMMKRYGVWES